LSDNANIKQLVKNLKKGVIFSFDKIYHKYNRKIYSFSLSYLKNKEDAEDVVQEVFMNLWRKRSDLKEQYNLNSYLFTITFNAIRRRFQDSARDKKYLENYAKTIPVDQDRENTDIEYNNLLELVNKVIEKLPPQQKKVFLLCNKEGLSNGEISDKLHISKKTVENHLHRAKKFLKQAVEDERLITLLFICLFITY
jgi:RNA polymerase sigma-70 factor (family 1)